MSVRSSAASQSPTRQRDVIETTRTYRTPHSTTTSSSLTLIEPIKRPGHGTKGVPVDLLINWFRFKFRQSRIFIYKVKVSEDAPPGRGRGRGRGGRGGPGGAPRQITNPDTLSKVFWSVVREYRHDFADPYRIVFDDFEYVFTPDRIEMNESEGLQLVAPHPDKPNQKVRMHLSCHKAFDLSLQGDVDTNEDSQWSSIYFKNILSQNSRYQPGSGATDLQKKVADQFAHFDGGMFFIPRHSKAPKIDVLPGVQAWLGLYASVRRMENFDPVINFPIINKLFVQMNLDLVTFYLNVENDTLSGSSPQAIGLNRNSCMSPASADRFNRKLKDIKLKCENAPGTDKDGLVTGKVERHYKFVSLKEDVCAARHFLRVEDLRQPRRLVKEFYTPRGERRSIMRQFSDVRMDEWYSEIGAPLRYPNLPLCLVKSGKKEDLIPMEMLFTHDQPQKYIKLLDFYARMKITRKLVRTPQDHYNITKKLIKDKLDYDKDPFMNALEMSLNPQMIEVEGRVVEPCAVLAKSESDESLTPLEVRKQSGDFFISRAVETSNKTIRFAVFQLTDQVNQTQMGEFYRTLVKKALIRGFNIPAVDYERPPILEENLSRHYADLKAMVSRVHGLFATSDKSKNEILVCLFFTDMVANLYGALKYICDCEYGIVSQVIDELSVKKSCRISQDDAISDHKSIYHHICLKMNGKLGGVNQILAESDEPEWGHMPAHDRTMFMGIDVIHPSPNSPIRDVSLAAIVASMDRNAAKYASRIRVNGRCNETVQCFDHHFSALLAEYYSTNNYFPSRIVILRDGVSDSEMVPVASAELNSIRTAWKKCTNGQLLPQFTYIVVQKRHKTRLYRNDGEGRVSNPPMGTIVDKETVTPHMFDFYMVSHYTNLGTTRPIHYTVVYDDCESSADLVQEMIFRLCFLYARCSKPVSLPAPVYYAHLACERAGFHHEYAIRAGIYDEIVDKGEREQDRDYATRVEAMSQVIEKNLQVHRDYPGMHFI